MCLDGCGIQINNLLGEEDINPKGFHQAEAGTSMQTMMAPTIVIRAIVELLWAAAVEPTPQRDSHNIAHVIEYEMPLYEAVHQPRLHVDRSEQGVA